MVCYAKFVVGNTYHCIPEKDAKLDRTGQYLKVHDWTVFLDVVDGDKDAIACVTFDMGHTFAPRQYVSYYPMENNHNTPSSSKSTTTRKTWRFQSRQQTYGTISIQIQIFGFGQTVLKVRHDLKLEPGGAISNIQHFVEDQKQFFQPNPLPPKYQFSLKLEFLSSSSSFPSFPTTSSSTSSTSKSCTTTHLQDLQQQQKHEIETKLNEIIQNRHQWQIYNDGLSQLIVVSSSFLHGDGGLKECMFVLKELFSFSLSSASSSPSASNKIRFLPRVVIQPVNQEVPQFVQVDQLCKIFLNFIRYEDVIDKVMPLRPLLQVFDNEDEELLEELDQEKVIPPKSNKRNIPGDSNKERHDTISSCTTLQELIECINPGCNGGQHQYQEMSHNRGEEIYKLNLKTYPNNNYNNHNNNNQNIQLEFRFGLMTIKEEQQSNTLNDCLENSIETVLDLIRFSMYFVANSVHYRKPTFLQEKSKGGQHRSMEEQLDMMFNYVIKDRYLAAKSRYYTTTNIASSSVFSSSSSFSTDFGLSTQPQQPQQLHDNDEDEYSLNILSRAAMTRLPVEVMEIDHHEPSSLPSSRKRLRPHPKIMTPPPATTTNILAMGDYDYKDPTESYHDPTNNNNRPLDCWDNSYNNAGTVVVPTTMTNSKAISKDSYSSTNNNSNSNNKNMIPTPYHIDGEMLGGLEFRTTIINKNNQQQKRTSAIGGNDQFYPIRKITLTELLELHTTRKNNLKRKKDHLTYRDLWYILEKINRPKDRDMIRRIEEMIEYFQAKPNRTIDLIMASGGSGSSRNASDLGGGGVIIGGKQQTKEDECRRKWLLTVSLGGKKLIEERPKTKVAESTVSFEEIQDVLEILGQPEPQTLQDGILDLDQYLEKEELFHLLVQFPKNKKA